MFIQATWWRKIVQRLHGNTLQLVNVRRRRDNTSASCFKLGKAHMTLVALGPHRCDTATAEAAAGAQGARLTLPARRPMHRDRCSPLKVCTGAKTSQQAHMPISPSTACS